MLVGLVPREIGRRVDPYDAYPSQFDATLEPRAIWEHARLLGLHCLPRLIAGTELDQLEKAGASTPTLAHRAGRLERGTRFDRPCRGRVNGWRSCS